MSKTNQIQIEKLKNQRAMVEGVNSLINKYKSVEQAVDDLPIDKNLGQFKRLKDALMKYRNELENAKTE